MIKANELRIGVLVLDGNEILQVNARMIGMVERGEAEFDPIPITEEWLVRLGFQSVIGMKYDGDQCWSEVINYQKNGLFLNNLDRRWEIFGVVIRKQPKYIHEIQNIYDSFHDEELTVNDLNK